MGSLGFTLADRLGARSIPCSVHGCTRTWLQMSGKGASLGGRSGVDANDPSSTMCEPCREKFLSLAPQELRCDRPGCEATWTWTVAAQLQAFVAHQGPPRHLCPDDEAKLAGLADRPVACAVAGCSRQAVFTRRDQLIAGAPEIEPELPVMMCGPCGNVYGKLKDRPISCTVRGCKNKWSWPRDAQIQAYAAGLPNEPPRRLCGSCEAAFGEIAERQVRCRTSGCKNTWGWSRESQMAGLVAGKPAPKAPHRMCQRCVDLYGKMVDVERPCRRPGCKNTWTDKRGAQLARAVRGKTGDPFPHYCSECEKELGDLADRPVPCKTESCPGTWTWTREQQLAAGVRPVPRHETAEGQVAGHATAGQNEGQHAEVTGTPPATNGAHAHQAGPALEAQEHEADHHEDDHSEADLHEAEHSEGAEAPDASEAKAAGAPGAAVAAPSAQGAPGGGRRRRRRRRREIRPPERRCDDCIAFLKDRKTREIPCTGCHTPIFWPPESQLQTHLGNWAEPTLCGACKRDLTEAARLAEREAIRQAAHHASHPGPEGLQAGGQAPSSAEAGDDRATDDDASQMGAATETSSGPDASQSPDDVPTPDSSDDAVSSSPTAD